MTAIFQHVTDGAVVTAVATGLVSIALYGHKRWSQDRSVNKAIMAEVQRLLEAIKRHRDFWNERVKDKTTCQHPLIPFAHLVYDRQVANVGVVHCNKVADVVRFFGYVDYLNQFQALRKFYDDAENTEEFNRRYIGVLNGVLETFRCLL